MSTTSHAPAVVLGLSGTVSDFIGKMERDLGVDGTELTVLFCVAAAALIVLLLVFNRASKRRALRLAHAGRFAAYDPFARSFRLHRSTRVDSVPDPVTHGPARDISNPRFRPEIQLPEVPDPVFPTLEEIRIAAAAEEAAVGQSGLPEVSQQRITVGIDAATQSTPVGSGVAVATAAPIPGWYEDPTGAPGGLRYWDGNAWTVRRPA